MSNVIKVNFPKKSIRKYPRQRVFYIGQYYCGPPLSQSLQKPWLKRKPNNRWVFLEYHYGRAYEQEEYYGDDLPNVLDNVPMVEEVCAKYLKKRLPLCFPKKVTPYELTVKI